MNSIVIPTHYKNPPPGATDRNQTAIAGQTLVRIRPAPGFCPSRANTGSSPPGSNFGTTSDEKCDTVKQGYGENRVSLFTLSGLRTDRRTASDGDRRSWSMSTACCIISFYKEINYGLMPVDLQPQIPEAAAMRPGKFQLGR